MKTSAVFHHNLGGSPHLLSEQRDENRLRNVSLVLVAIIAFVIGLFLGQTNESAPSGSRIHWPTKVEIFR